MNYCGLIFSFLVPGIFIGMLATKIMIEQQENRRKSAKRRR